ncbi:peptidoglycan/xylan/chitin deacetylase (PgdA/CDA1 family) [Amycolatopsis sulphurea]|uniref:Peptidoglycan/xylan/chitin deacetylase (PgdA/CDA1 family) n=1 Tax=Amycolatopsis sulphurea TaxID=76022 RepID=A0A2A9F976_9PSEU|nr:peptidoglycan/xylan/chitin deacetylase (PgdA/CDA1 family) [Amycolatopsis sulphurea]
MAGNPGAGGGVKKVLKAAVRAGTGAIGSVRAVRTTRPHVVLTFDDGPDPVGTERVLSALAEHATTATFFVLTERVARFPRLLAETAAEGHEIALHGFDHCRLTRFRFREVVARVSAARRQLEDTLGAPVRWFRPPFGAQTPSTWRAIRRTGLEPVMWGPTAWDWLDEPVPDLAARAMERLVRGSILLAHDGYAGDPEQPSGTAPTFDRGELTAAVLEGIAERGLRGVSLADALAAGGTAERWAWFRR